MLIIGGIQSGHVSAWVGARWVVEEVRMVCVVHVGGHGHDVDLTATLTTWQVVFNVFPVP